MSARPAIPLDTDFIYVIVNEANGRRYVGRTGQYVCERWGLHRSALRGNRHQNALLQQDWNRDGQDAFTIDVVTQVTGYRGQIEEESLTLRYFEAGIPLYNRVAGAKPFSCKALNVQPGDILEYAPDHEALEPARRILATPVCQSCGMRHEPGDTSSCIEGHGDD